MSEGPWVTFMEAYTDESGLEAAMSGLRYTAWPKALAPERAIYHVSFAAHSARPLINSDGGTFFDVGATRDAGGDGGGG